MGDTGDPTRSARVSSRLPSQIGEFRILRLIGAGGMGVVYEAEQPHPKRAVALKVVRGGGYVDDTHVRMFRREVQTLARLKHPGIAAIYESGATEDGQHYFAMELVRGETLGEYLGKRNSAGPLAPDEVKERLQLFRKICDAIAYAHQRGVIHRDLKPANVLVLREGSGSGVPDIKVLDFGLARITDSDVAVSTVLTDLGTVQGTLPYMSPEQVRGNADEIDLRTDVYSLGVLLYEMLSGELPQEVKRLPLTEAVRVICEEAPQALSRRWKGARKLDGDLSTLVHKALEKEPSRRYQSVGSLSEDVQRYLTDQPILARPPSAAYQLRKLVSRHKGAFAFVASVVVLLLGFALTMAVQAGRIARERDRANREAQTAEKVSEFLVGLFRVSDPFEAQGNTVTARELLDEGAKRIERELVGEPLVEARLLDTMGNAYRSLGLYESAGPLLERGLALRESLLGPEAPEVAKSLNSISYLDYWRGQYEAATEVSRRAVAICEKELGPEALDLGWSQYYLGTTLSMNGKYLEAQPILERALQVFEKNLGLESIAVSWCLNDLGGLHQKLGETEIAIPLLQRSLAIKEKCLGPEHPDVSIGLVNVAIVIAESGDYAAAIPLFTRALEISEKANGPEHPSTALCMNWLGWTQMMAGDYDSAEFNLKGALDLGERIYGSEHPWVGSWVGTLGELYRRTGRYAEARLALERAVSILEKDLAPDHSELILNLHYYAKLLLDLGELAPAEAVFRRVLAARQEVSRPKDLAETLEDYARLLRLTNRLTQAESLETRAREILSKPAKNAGTSHTSNSRGATSG